MSPATISVLKKLVALFGLTQMLASMGDFLESGFLSPQQAGAAREAHHQLLVQLRPEAVALVDAFAIPDYLLDSALGRYDGDVYRQGCPCIASLYPFCTSLSKRPELKCLPHAAARDLLQLLDDSAGMIL